MNALTVSVTIVLLVVLAHLPLRHSEYIQDDHLAVEENVIVARGDLGEILGSTYWEGASGQDRSLYRPVVIASYALERRLTGRPNALVSQIFNLILHAATSVLLWLLARRIGLGALGSAAAALLFSVHPVHLEAVGGIVGRAEILAAGFSFLALWLQSHAGPWYSADRSTIERPVRPRAAAIGAGVALFLALGSKEGAVATPLLMLALELACRPHERGGSLATWLRRAAERLLPAGIAGGAYLAFRVHALEMFFVIPQIHPLDNRLVELGGVERWATALGLLTRYAGLLLYPHALSADYSGTVIDVEPGLFTARALVGLSLLALLVGLALVPLVRRAVALRSGAAPPPVKLAAFASILFLLPYLVIGNLLRDIGTIFAERLLYFPSAGFVLLLGCLLEWAVRAPQSERQRGRQQRLALAIVGVMLLAFVVRSWSRSLDWRDDGTLFAAAAEVCDASPRAHYILGMLHSRSGREDEALEQMRKVIERYPDYPAAWFERGVIYGQRGEYRRAETAFRETLRLSPRYAKALTNLGMALSAQGRKAEARRELERAVLHDAGIARAWAELGNIARAEGRYRDAIRAYRRAMELGRPGIEQRLAEVERLARSGS
ncbi:MAG: tetratricopeptide repeat protein [Planctomycetes bacterium]|nr:tetratricopeptide repeat protein [Planctomycetota bacterium]